MALSAKDQRLLEELQRKAKEPDRTRSANYHVHLHTNDPEERAIAERLGLLGEADDDGDQDAGEDESGDEDGGDTPRRRGYYRD